MKLNIQTLSLITLTVLGAASLQSCKPNRAHAYNARTNVDVNGLAFIKGAHEGSLTEIEASKLAQKNSSNKEVTDFAAMMIKDHSEAAIEIDTLADHKYVFLKKVVNKEHKTLLDTLSTKTGAEFDKGYMAMMVADHEEAEELYKENLDSTYPDIREFAEKISVKIKSHLEEAKKIKASLK